MLPKNDVNTIAGFIHDANKQSAFAAEFGDLVELQRYARLIDNHADGLGTDPNTLFQLLLQGSLDRDDQHYDDYTKDDVDFDFSDEGDPDEDNL